MTVLPEIVSQAWEEREGPVWNPTRLPGHAVAAVRVEQSFAGAKQLA